MLNQTYHEISRWDFSFYPQDMCRVTDNEFAITCNLKDDSSHRHEVKFFSVTNDTIVEGNTMNLQHNCIGITHHRGELFVTSGTALHTYSMIGELVKTLYEDKTGHLTVLKCAVSHQGDIIFVTNFEQHKLLTLARDGSIISTFADPELKEPWDVHVTSASHVLVCGWSSNNIVQVDSEGRTKLAVLALEGVENPESIYYNVNNHSIIVGQCKSNYIVVFNLKLHCISCII
ncbi:hypothetical protein DPMN_181510 [Dreissena polymorpha]|uniref:Uncharacterized protein n=1 Tax=Dreissena polymorpha TaxID=45954 RepID=A0A9D4DE96_DREPO|nr:hypothetical protein DPMN_181510 [Dreissena polymorpha]